MSDLHLEFYPRTDSNPYPFIENLANHPETNLILAGDIHSYLLIEGALRAFASKFKRVFYVTGNHEYYGTSKQKIDMILNSINLDNFFWLDKTRVEIEEEGRTIGIAGATLWFKDDPLNMLYEKGMNDFQYIKNFRQWVYDENKQAVDFFISNIKKGDIVITHHLPSHSSVSPKFKNSALNRFFANELDDLIKITEPSLWVHGHTHEFFNYMLHNTEVLCNPRGYPNEKTGLYVPILKTH